MSNAKKSNYEKRLEYQQTVTKEPDKNTIAAWYDVEPRTMRDRYVQDGVRIRHKTLSASDLGEIFCKCGMPPKIPKELIGWMNELIAAYRRLLP